MTTRRSVALGLACLVVLAWPVARGVGDLMVTRRVVAAYVALIGAGNAQDLDMVRSLCSAGYLGTRPIASAPGGGVVGVPRNIHRNFRAWREGEEGRLCPGDRVGVVYRFVRERGAWKFAGAVGMLRPGGRVEPIERDGENP